MAQNENVVFKLILDTSSYDKTLSELGSETTKADKSFKDLNDTISKGAKGMQEVATAKKNYNDLNEVSIAQTKALTAELQNALVKDKEFMAVGKQVSDAYKKGKIDEVQATKLLEDAINKGVDATRKMQVETTKVASNLKSYRAQVMELRQILPTLSGDEYVKAQAKLATLISAMKDQEAQVKILASTTRALDTAMQGLQLGVGIFAGLQGASALFGSENENVQKALLKVNGAMAVLQSLQTIQNTLDKKSGFVNSVKLYWKSLFVKETVAETVAMEVNTVATEANTVIQTESTLATKAASIWQGIYTFAVEASSGALRLFKIALASTGIGVAIIGLGLLIANFDKVKEAIRENTEGFQTFKKVLLFISPPIALIIKAFETLMRNIDEIKNTLMGFGSAVNEVFGNIGNSITKLTNLDFKGFYNDVKNVGKGVSDAYTQGYIEQENKNSKLRQSNRLSFLDSLAKQEIELLEAQGKDTTKMQSLSLSRQLKAKLVVLSEQEKQELQMTREGIANRGKLSDAQLVLLEKGATKYKDILDIEQQLLLNYYKNNQKSLEDAKKKAEAKTKERVILDQLEITSQRDKPLDEKMLHDLLDKAKEQVVKLFASEKIEVKPIIEFKSDKTKTIEAFQDDVKKIKGYVDVFAGYINKSLGLADQAIDRKIQRIDNAIDYQKNSIERARDLADKGNAQLLDAEQKKLQALELLRRQESQKKKALAISQAVVNTAVAVTSALATHPFLPLGPIMAALAASLGAVEIGIISSQQFAKGGFTGNGLGQRDETGHIPVGIVHDNEFVLDKSYTTQNRKELEYIHKNRINIADLMTMPNLTMNPILSNYHVNELGELKKEMQEVKNAIKDLPKHMPQAEMHVGIRGLSITTKNINEREQRWKR